MALIARPLADPAASLPLTGALVAAPAGATRASSSARRWSTSTARAGQSSTLPLPDGRRAAVFVRGVWRDYARQFGAVVIDAADYRAPHRRRRA